MKLSPARSSAAVESATVAVVSLALLVTPVASMLDCKNIVVDGQKFNFGALEGPHSVVTWQKHEQPRPWEFVNSTYTVDLCRALVKKGGAEDSESCPNGTRVCGIKRGKHPGKDDWEVFDVLAIAGELSENGGGAHGLDPHVARLKTSDSHSDSKKEGVRITMSGGRAPLERNGKEQRAVIEMLCDKNKDGTEGEVDPTGEYISVPADGASQRRAEGEEDGQDGNESPTTEHQLLKTGDKNGTALIFDSYGPLADNGRLDILRLTWYTKFACESQDDNGGEGRSGSNEHWGFFTWLFMLVFLGTAAYLVFGSWLNYSRYGARGWDLLPHGDTIRDIPYLLKDWTRRVMNTVQGTGSRGGYSAV